MATVSHYELCVTTEYWSPWFSTHSDWMLDFSGGRAGTIATAYSFLFLPSAFKMCSFLCFPQCNCHFVGFVMQTNVFTFYNDLFAFGCGVDCKPSIFYVCAVLAWCLRCVTLRASQCSRGCGECVVWLPYLLPPALISCVSSPQLAPLYCSGFKSTAVPDRLIQTDTRLSGRLFFC